MAPASPDRRRWRDSGGDAARPARKAPHRHGSRERVGELDTVEPAVQSVWDIVSEGLRERALFVLVIGLAFVGAGWLAGPGRIAVGVRRSLAPSLRDHPVAVYASVAVLFLLWLAFIPGIDNLGQILVIVLLAVLAMVGIAILRRQTAREFSSPSDALTRPGGQA